MKKFIAILSSLSLISCTSFDSVKNARNYEATPNKNWQYGAMVVSANPIATAAGANILRQGGSAIDAAIAVQSVLGLVEPQSSGIGGGGFMVYYDAKTGDVKTFDGREKAPMSANEDYFIDKETDIPMYFIDAVKSGKSTGAPSVIDMLHNAWSQYGKLPWYKGFEEAAQIANQGFPLSKRLHDVVKQLQGITEPSEDIKSYLLGANNLPKPVGTIIKNPEYAKTMLEIGNTQLQSFYKGRIARDIVNAVQANPIAGALTLEDMASVKSEVKDPLCMNYRSHLICGVGPPSSGGIATLMILGILENFDMKSFGNNAQGWHNFIESQKLAYMDRDSYVGDDKFVKVPVKGLLDKEYLKNRASLIKQDYVIENITAGKPKGANKIGKDRQGAYGGTSHFVIIDKDGNVVSMTSSVEFYFGSQKMVDGFFLNNQLTDFSFVAKDGYGVPIVNRVQAGKKPRSSMSPTIIFDKNGHFEMAVGSPGGNSIIAYVSKVIIGILDWDLSPKEAIELPNLIARKVPSNLEYSRMDVKLREQLEAMGHKFTSSGSPEGSGLHVIMLKDGKLIGAADPRREGNVIAIQ